MVEGVYKDNKYRVFISRKHFLFNLKHFCQTLIFTLEILINRVHIYNEGKLLIFNFNL